MGGRIMRKRQGTRTAGILLYLFLLLAAGWLSACSKAEHPAGLVALRFFDAVDREDPEAMRLLLDPVTRTEFEAAMGDAELKSYLEDANSLLRDTYGAGWRSRVRVRETVAEADTAAGTPWSVRVGIGGEKTEEQIVPVLETASGFWLNLWLQDESHEGG